MKKTYKGFVGDDGFYNNYYGEKPKLVPRPRQKIIKFFLAAFLIVFGGLILALINTAKADEFGTFCIDKNGVERCTIWQWDSEAQRLIKKEIERASVTVKK